MNIDFHTHIVPETFPEQPPDETSWPEIRSARDGTAEIFVNERPFRAIDRRSWDFSARLKDMDKDRIDIQVLSPMPELLSYWFSAKNCALMCDWVNRHILDMVNASPERFRGVGMVPLQDPELAVDHLRKLQSAGMIGVLIGSHVNGVPLGDPTFAPFFAAAEEAGLFVMVHALHPAGVERIGGQPDMAAAAVFPLETALAAVSLMTSGVFERHENLKIFLSHGGGALAAILPRLDQAWRCGLSISRSSPVPPSQTAKKFYYDSLVYGAAPLINLVETVGSGHLAMGTDYPFAIKQDDPVSFLNDAIGEAAIEILAGPYALKNTGTPTNV